MAEAYFNPVFNSLIGLLRMPRHVHDNAAQDLLATAMREVKKPECPFTGVIRRKLSEFQLVGNTSMAPIVAG